MRDLILAPNLHVNPVEAASQKVAFIARSGNGKTYAAMKYAEELLEHGQQIVPIDPVGVWWGLRLDKDGERKSGFDIPIFGGQRGDLPLEPAAGALMAELVAEGHSMVLDVSEMTLGELYRFVEVFATELLRLKKQHPSAVMLMWEEAQDIMPERVDNRTARMYHAVSRLIKIGRNFGIGTGIISQRPQAISKDVLNQTEMLIVFQINGKHERKALQEWVMYQGLETKMVDELPGLARGDGFIWSPQWLRKLEHVRFNEKKSFDASATPGRSTPRSVKPTQIDLAKIREKMAETVQRAEENDVGKLKAKIADLMRQLGNVTPRVPHDIKVTNAQIEATIKSAVAEDAGKLKAELEEIMFNFRRSTVEKARDLFKEISEAVYTLCDTPLAQVGERVREIRAKMAKINPDLVVPPLPKTKLLRPQGKTALLAVPWTPTTAPKVGDRFKVNGKVREVSQVGTSGEQDIGQGDRRTLIALAQRSDREVKTRELAAVTGVSERTVQNQLGRLRGLGYVDGYRITDGGIQAAGNYEPLPAPGYELQEWWQARLPTTDAHCFKLLCHASTRLSTADLATALHISERTVQNIIGRLRAKSIVDGSGAGGYAIDEAVRG